MGRVLRTIGHVAPRVLIPVGIALGLLAGLNYLASLFITSLWTQGFLVCAAAVVLGDIASFVEDRWIYGPPKEPPDSSAEDDPAVVAAARAMCSEWAGRPPCSGCLANAKRAIRAFEAARGAP